MSTPSQLSLFGGLGAPAPEASSSDEANPAAPESVASAPEGVEPSALVPDGASHGQAAPSSSSDSVADGPSGSAIASVAASPTASSSPEDVEPADPEPDAAWASSSVPPSLFPAADVPKVGLAPEAEELRPLAAAMPAGVRFGTSSWSFPGWAGQVYDREYSSPALVRDGLAAYAQHPLLRTVGVDRTYYAPIARDVFASMAAQVGDDFRFLVKAHEDCLCHTFPSHPRYGARGGERNPRFLDAAYARDAVVGPAVDGLGEKLGVLLFQAPPQDVFAIGGPGRFAVLLDRFLEGIRADINVAFELRNASLLTRDVSDVLREHGASACISHHPQLPAVEEQAKRWGAARGPLVVRWMLRRGLRYDAAKRRYAPFSKIVDPDDSTRDSIVRLSVEAVSAGRPVYVIVNNKAEGSSPASITRLAEALKNQQLA